MHPLHDYLCQRLHDRLKKHRVVVFYDERAEFLEIGIVGHGQVSWTDVP